MPIDIPPDLQEKSLDELIVVALRQGSIDAAHIRNDTVTLEFEGERFSWESEDAAHMLRMMIAVRRDFDRLFGDSEF